MPPLHKHQRIQKICCSGKPKTFSTPPKRKWRT